MEITKEQLYEILYEAKQHAMCGALAKDEGEIGNIMSAGIYRKRAREAAERLRLLLVGVGYWP